jgi:F-type H+-transporting ATPase subunit a
MTFHTPFEQFEIFPIFKLTLLTFDLSFTNLAATIICIVCLLITFLYLADKSYQYIPNNWQIVMESTYQFIYAITSEQANRKGIKYFPQLFTIFLLIMFLNLSGLSPLTMTATSHVIITFGLALSYFIAWVIIGIYELGPKFLYIFCPRNMPAWLLPLLICIEFLSFCLRPISLGVRLFANMLAGHVLLYILAGACVYLLLKLFVLAIPAFAIIGAIGVLELGIGFLQSYIFTILLAIYLKDSLYSH